jgi:soluble P-type ATPase
MGNGANDRLMLAAALLGICVLGTEGAATPSLVASDIVVRNAADGLDLLLHPGRLAATLRV